MAQRLRIAHCPIIRTKGLGVHANWGMSGWFTQKQYSDGGALVDMGVRAIDACTFCWAIHYQRRCMP
ncbi:MAG: hypothetical protein ACK5GU_13020 [Chloroflexota bacterium]